jgi:hypothetical protein
MIFASLVVISLRAALRAREAGDARLCGSTSPGDINQHGNEAEEEID